MRRGGEDSWRLSVDDKCDLLHAATFVRDACRLRSPDDSFPPPPLEGDLPDLSAGLDSGVREAAGHQWGAWWQAILTYERAKALGTLELLEGPGGRMDSQVIVDQHPFDWADLDALATAPELRRAVQVSHDDAVRWQQEWNRRLQGRDPRSRGLQHVAPSSIARQLQERLDVPLARIRAAVFVLGVRGTWSALPLPGLLLISSFLAADSGRLGPLLDAAFASGVDAPEVPLPVRERTFRPLPPSVLAAPVLLWETPGKSLTCERVIPYKDGFEIELRRHGIGPAPTPQWRGPGGRRVNPFRGLRVTLRYADGREEVLDDIGRDDRQGPVTVTAFGRRGSGDDALWLWVMPLPPPGEVRLGVEWPDYGIGPVSASFDGATIRPEEDP